MAKRTIFCPRCGKEIETYRNPVPTVDVIIEIESRGIVLIRRKNPPYGWAIPGGFVDYGESLEEAARREAKEETGITKLRYKATLEPISYIYTRNGKPIHKTVYYALFSYTGKEPLVPQTEEGISEIVWLPIAKSCAMIGYPKSNRPIIQAVINLL